MQRLAREGATVAIFDIDSAEGSRVASELTSQSHSVHFYEVDVSDKAACVEAVEKFTDSLTLSRRGLLHYLVNCAAFFGSKGLTAERADWERSFAVNATGYANMVQACCPAMSARRHHDDGTAKGGGGCGTRSIVNVASISAHRAQPNRWTYAATKGAIASMTRCMALDLSSEGVRVNSVSPAWVWSPEVAKAAGAGGRDRWEPVWGAFHMARRLAECSEVAAAICFLLSDDASFVTAADLPVDGGYLSLGPEGLGEHSSFAGTDY